MRKLFLVAILFLGGFACTQAQQDASQSSSESTQRDYSSIIDRRVESLTESLSLTDSQVSQVRAIYEKTLGAQADEESGMSSSDQRHSEIMDLLNADQKPIYQAYLDESSSRSFGARSGGGESSQMEVSSLIDSRVQDLTERLSLTVNQIAQVRAIYEKTLGAQVEEGGEEVNSADQRHSEIMDLLNADQKEIYSDYLENRSSMSRNRSSMLSGAGSGDGESSQMEVSSIIDSRVQDLTERLSLTDDQVIQVRAIYEKTLGAQVEEGGEAVNSADLRHSEIMDLLNTDQKTIYQTYLDERSQRGSRFSE